MPPTARKVAGRPTACRVMGVQTTLHSTCLPFQDDTSGRCYVPRLPVPGSLHCQVLLIVRTSIAAGVWSSERQRRGHGRRDHTDDGQNACLLSCQPPSSNTHRSRAQAEYRPSNHRADIILWTPPASTLTTDRLDVRPGTSTVFFLGGETHVMERLDRLPPHLEIPCAAADRSSGCDDISIGKASTRPPAAHTQFCLLFYERLRSLAVITRSSSRKHSTKYLQLFL